MSFAQITLLGHVGRDPEMSYTSDGTPVTKFSLATNRKVKNQDVTTWWNCTAFRGLGETINAHVHKGDMVLCVGTFDARQYTTRDGKPGVSLDVVVDKFAFAGGRKMTEGVREVSNEESLPPDIPEGEPPPF